MEQPNAMSQYPSVDYYSVLMQHSGESNPSKSFSVLIGTQADGTMLTADLDQIPHMLVCGYSGTGKSSFVQAIILWLAHTHSREQVQFVLFDSKGVDYASLQSLPHLYCPVVTTESKALSIISLLAEESEARCKLFQQTHCQDVLSFNKQYSQRKTIPHIYIVLDDFASLMLYNKYNVPVSLLNVLQNGRTAGIHLILITSLTNTKTLPKSILTNIPHRISFGVSSRADSRLAIDKEGAEILRSPGELMFKGQGSLQKCQGAYLSDIQMQNVLKKIKREHLLQINTLGDMAEQIFKEVSDHNKQESSQSSSEDQLIRMMMDRCVELGQVSTTVIQRHLRIGYAKAARILDQMEDLGLIEPSQGVKPRKVLLTREQWETVKNQSGSLSSIRPFLMSVQQSVTSEDDNTYSVSHESSDNNLKDFMQVSLGKIQLAFIDNCLIIKVKVLTEQGPGTSTIRIEGKSLVNLGLTQPHLFSKGNIRFKLKPHVKIINNNPELISIRRFNYSNYLTIEFGITDTLRLKLFMKRIAKSLNIPLTIL